VGADDSLNKSFHFAEVALHLALARRQLNAHPRLHTIVDLALDPQRHSPVYTVDLSANAFAVLETLVRATPAIVSINALIREIWGGNADPFSNVAFKHS
jgi:DNA-binding response OmpR family regulator